MKRFRSIISLLLALLLIPGAFSACAETDEEVLEGILANFEQLAAIPRPSHHEEKVGAFLVAWAQAQGFDVYQDETGNVIFDVPATEGYEEAPTVALQAHMDMVAVSSDPNFDALNTPVRTIRSEDTLTADGTSLGADDGIGVASILYLATSQAAHGPLRAIITVNEEDGMTGMFGLDASVVEDVSFLLNLDAETLGEAIISSAAGTVLTAAQEPLRTAPTLDAAVSVTLDGLLGGHSGVMIDKGRINAVQALGDLLLSLRQAGVSYELASFQGGTAANAIPTSATALLVVGAQDAARVETITGEYAKALASAYSASDPGLTATVSQAEMPQTVFDASQAENIVDYAALVFDGLHTLSQSVQGLVESSSNLGVFRADADAVTSVQYVRSSQAALQDSICLKQQRLAERLGFTVSRQKMAEAWPVNTGSTLQSIMQEVYREQTGEELKLACVHAGLECGTFARMNEALDIISIGPELHDVHSVKETLYLDSIVPFYRLLEGTLARLSEAR